MEWVKLLGQFSGSLLGIGVLAYFAKKIIEIPKEYVTKADHKIVVEKLDAVQNDVSYIKGKIDATIRTNIKE